jgi:aspartyl-tRNA(Asn)/glutamyl-tRNA(Gln) amidotransferase subunit A
VAAGIFWAGIGTDTGGSIRMPSALCGITGIKPTFGRVPKSGVVPLSWSFDHVGPMARTARDCALMLDVIAGHDSSDPLSADVATDASAAALDGSVAGVRVGVLRRAYVDAPFVDPTAIAAFEFALAALEAGGAHVEEVDVPEWDILNEACLPIFMTEALAYHRRNLAEHWDDYGSFTRQMVAAALF